MFNQEIRNIANLARNQFGVLGGYDPSLTWKEDLAALHELNGTRELIEQAERQAAAKDKKLDYEYDNMDLQHPKSYHESLKPLLDTISEKQPHLKLYRTVGKTFWEYKDEKNDIKDCEILRLEAPDGYVMDWEPDIQTNVDRKRIKVCHIKFIMQRDTKKQGNSFRMARHVDHCADVLFNQGVVYLWGWAARMNQWNVRKTRHGENWRKEMCQITDYNGELSPATIRLLAMYLRHGWMRLHEQKEGEELIAYMSPEGIEFMVEKMGNESLEEFKYAKNYEETYRRYKI
jgi:hypothetical protein